MHRVNSALKRRTPRKALTKPVGIIGKQTGENRRDRYLLALGSAGRHTRVPEALEVIGLRQMSARRKIGAQDLD